MYRVLTAEYHEITRTGINYLIEQQPFFHVAAEATNTTDLINIVNQGNVDLIIMGLDMPGENGLLTIRQLHNSYPELPILVLSEHEELACVKKCFFFGAAGYVLKCSSNDEIVNALDALIHRRQYLDSNITVSEINLYQTLPTNQCIREYDKLSPREREVFPLAVLGYENKEIAQRLCISTKTVETHKTHMMRKLSLDCHVDLIHYAAKNHLVNF